MCLDCHFFSCICAEEEPILDGMWNGCDRNRNFPQAAPFPFSLSWRKPPISTLWKGKSERVFNAEQQETLLELWTISCTVCSAFHSSLAVISPPDLSPFLMKTLILQEHICIVRVRRFWFLYVQIALKPCPISVDLYMRSQTHSWWHHLEKEQAVDFQRYTIAP